MAKITYLLGAGASCNCLPIVENMSKGIWLTTQWLEGKHYEIYPRTHLVNGIEMLRADIEKEKAELNLIIKELRWLQDICDTSQNFSVDTFARKLNISGRGDDYDKLKNVLSLYFTLEQRRNPPDVRYDNFWASILQTRNRFPDNIRILSWNYDFQLELTYTDFFNHDSLSVARENMNLASPEMDFADFGSPNKFGVFKLNGSATFNANSIKDSNTKYFIDKFKTSSDDSFIKELIEKYFLISSTPRIHLKHLKFAWEHLNYKSTPFFTHLENAVNDTEILVVIGYSFPFFNRDIDKFVLKDTMQKLDKVYFQSPDAENLRERFLAIRDDISEKKLVLRKDIKQFTLPNEL